MKLELLGIQCLVDTCRHEGLNLGPGITVLLMYRRASQGQILCIKTYNKKQESVVFDVKLNIETYGEAM